MVERGEKRYSVQNENSILPRAKDEYAPKRMNGQTKDHPMQRMVMSNQRGDHEE